MRLLRKATTLASLGRCHQGTQTHLPTTATVGLRDRFTLSFRNSLPIRQSFPVPGEGQFPACRTVYRGITASRARIQKEAPITTRFRSASSKLVPTGYTLPSPILIRIPWTTDRAMKAHTGQVASSVLGVQTTTPPVIPSSIMETLISTLGIAWLVHTSLRFRCLPQSRTTAFCEPRSVAGGLAE